METYKGSALGFFVDFHNGVIITYYENGEDKEYVDDSAYLLQVLKEDYLPRFKVKDE